MLSCLQYRCEGKGAEWAGFHFLLTGGFETPCLTKVEVQNIVKMPGAKLIPRESDPELIIKQHALTISTMVFT